MDKKPEMNEVRITTSGISIVKFNRNLVKAELEKLRRKK